MSDFSIHLTADIIGETDWSLSRTRALLAPAQPVLGILDNGDPLAKLAAKRCMAGSDFTQQRLTNQIQTFTHKAGLFSCAKGTSPKIR